MSNFPQELDEDFKDAADYQPLSEEEKHRIVSVLEKMMDMGIGTVYGDEDDDMPDTDDPCTGVIDQCQV
jgi:hypothetical protein